MNVYVACERETLVPEDLRTMAHTTGRLLAQAGWVLLFGGGRDGMMGALAAGTVGDGGRLRAIVPQYESDADALHPAVQEVHMAGNGDDHLRLIHSHAQACLALPGGLFTLVTALKLLGDHAGRPSVLPIMFVGDRQTWGGLADSLKNMSRNGFLQADHGTRLQFHDSPQAALAWLMYEWPRC